MSVTTLPAQESGSDVLNGIVADQPGPIPSQSLEALSGLSDLLRDYPGIASASFTKEQVDILMDKIPDKDIEIRPDGLIYLPEIRYRRVLNRTFGPGCWALLPRSIDVRDGMLFYRGALFVHNRFVSEAIGEQPYAPGNDRMSYATAAEAAKSNCLVRCCKDLGIASELWDPSFIRSWLAEHAVEVWCTSRQDATKKKRFWRKRSAAPIDMWPWQENAPGNKSDSQPTNQPSSRAQSANRSQGTGVNQQPNESKKLISPRQAARFRAIAKEKGWSTNGVVALLQQHGFTSSVDISQSSYDDLCARLEAGV